MKYPTFQHLEALDRILKDLQLEPTEALLTEQQLHGLEPCDEDSAIRINLIEALKMIAEARQILSEIGDSF